MRVLERGRQYDPRRPFDLLVSVLTIMFLCFLPAGLHIRPPWRPPKPARRASRRAGAGLDPPQGVTAASPVVNAVCRPPSRRPNRCGHTTSGCSKAEPSQLLLAHQKPF
jgi:hypothetical protein